VQKFTTAVAFTATTQMNTFMSVGKLLYFPSLYNHGMLKCKGKRHKNVIKNVSTLFFTDTSIVLVGLCWQRRLLHFQLRSLSVGLKLFSSGSAKSRSFCLALFNKYVTLLRHFCGTFLTTPKCDTLQ